MNLQEYERLRKYMYAAKHRPITNPHQSRRVAKKNVGKAKGQRFLKNGYITHTVHPETIFKQHP